MSDDENFSLHSFNPDDEENENDIDQFYKELSLQFYGDDTEKKVSLLMSGSTQETNKPSRDTLPELKKGIVSVTPKSSRLGSPRQTRVIPKQRGSPYAKPAHTKKLIQLLQSPYNVKQTQKQAFLKKQLELIRKIQIQELKEHYYK